MDICEDEPLRLTFLGGADEIGASCTLLSNGGRRILVDCGVRMGGARDVLPHLAAIGSLDAIVITHAHLDHVGALPIVHGAFPEVPVFATAPTAAILRVMLGDALRIMEQKAEAEGEVPLYTPEAVGTLLARLQKVPLLDAIPLGDGAVTAQFFPAGHILGAASIGISGPEGKVLFSGDFSVTDQLTVPGMMAPRFEPDVAVVESTYGDRLHSSREAEERRLVARIGETIAAGGKVLIPAFALGRAQEVLLILKRAFARKELPPFPVYADGMVKSLCEVYRDFPEDLHVPLRRQMAKSHPFFPENGTIAKVASAAEREAVIQGPPCVVVASSGMLSGGASVVYARAWAGDRRNLIALTGYQDEESPGRALLDLASGACRELRLGGQAVAVEARTEKIGLSAHADRSEIVGLLSRLKPGRVVLVHGEDGARPALARALGHLDEDQIELPVLGDELDLTPRRRRERPASAGISGGAPLDEAALAHLADHLRAAPRLVNPRDLAILWAGGPDVSEDLVAQAARLLEHTGLFEPDARRPFLYRPANSTRTGASSAPAGGDTTPAGPIDQHRALEAVDRLIAKETGLYRRGVVLEDAAIVLSFHFPDVARARYAAQVEALASQTGYQVRLNPEPHLGELASRAQAALPPDVVSSRAPSIRRESREVCVKTKAPYTVPDDVLTAFREETGFTLAVNLEIAPPSASGKYDDQGRLEINATYAAVEAAFVGQAHAPRKKSKKADDSGPYLELSFISRSVGERYRDLIGDLELATGWAIRVGTTADQGAIIAAVQAVIPPDWGMARTPSLHLAAETAQIRLSSQPGQAAVTALSDRIEQATGFRLAIEAPAAPERK